MHSGMKQKMRVGDEDSLGGGDYTNASFLCFN